MPELKKDFIGLEQPFGNFYVVKFKASELLRLAFPDSFRIDNGVKRGIQRSLNKNRTKDIKDYIQSVDCAFPNSIILAANITEAGFIEDDDSIIWHVGEDKNTKKLIIPSERRLASIIDGQHRLYGFDGLDLESNPELDMDLLCSIYLDLPSSLQAYLFATINSNQRSVQKNLAYELFGYELTPSKANTWSPDKAAISIARQLNENSTLKDRIASPEATTRPDWSVSLSAVTDAILRLISTNPKKDKNTLSMLREDRRDRRVLEARNDRSPLRELYLNNRDDLILRIVSNYLLAAENANLFEDATSALTKTIGMHGLLDCLRKYLAWAMKDGTPLQEIEMRPDDFSEVLQPSVKVNFSDDFYLRTTGVGRTRIRQTVLYAYKPELEPNIKEDDLNKIKELLG